MAVAPCPAACATARGAAAIAAAAAPVPRMLRLIESIIGVLPDHGRIDDRLVDRCFIWCGSSVPPSFLVGRSLGYIRSSRGGAEHLEIDRDLAGLFELEGYRHLGSLLHLALELLQTDEVAAGRQHHLVAWGYRQPSADRVHAHRAPDHADLLEFDLFGDISRPSDQAVGRRSLV